MLTSAFSAICQCEVRVRWPLRHYNRLLKFRLLRDRETLITRKIGVFEAPGQAEKEVIPTIVDGWGLVKRTWSTQTFYASVNANEALHVKIVIEGNFSDCIPVCS